MNAIQYNQKSGIKTVFHEFPILEKGNGLAGYSALISNYELSAPLPGRLCAIGTKHKIVEHGRWKVFTPRYEPAQSVYGHLTFAFKNEGIDLAVLNALFKKIDSQTIVDIVESAPTGAYSRRIWFLYEWLTDIKLDLKGVVTGNFIDLINSKLQYAGPVRNSRRHRVRNNLPGVRNFCPLIRRTIKIDKFIADDLSQKAIRQIGNTHADLISRAAAFLLLKDSKASYTIEGENPPHNRIERWGNIIGQAGQRELSVDELEYLQEIVIPDFRFTLPGCRVEGGFVGDHDRVTGMPMPVHISARAEDLQTLLSGLIDTYKLLLDSEYDPVLMATLIAFGFVFIHPFEDGNGRIHRYLIHHVLAEKRFVPKGLVFPVSAVILDRITDYRKTLEWFSKPRLDLIQWRPTDKNNVEVLNDTIKLYQYFDATEQAEFLFSCVDETVNKTLPDEVDYLTKYDLLNVFIKNYIDLPDRKVDHLIRFLHQNQGLLSKRAREKEFKQLTLKEVKTIENKYDEIFKIDG